jgi:hypothetical protein
MPPKTNRSGGGGSTAKASPGFTPPQRDAGANQSAIGSTSALGNSFPGLQRAVTFEDEPLDHWISDAELNLMTELRKDNVVEIFWGTLGIFLGSIVSALEKWPKVGNADNPVGTIDLIVLIICGVSLILTVVMGFFWYQRSEKAENLATKIRNRKKFRIGSGETRNDAAG